MDVRQATTRLEVLRQETDRLMRAVRCEHEPSTSGYELEQGNTAILYCFVAALLVDTLAGDAHAIWPLLANRVSPELLQHPVVAAQKEYLSAPLNGTLTEILCRIGFYLSSDPGTKWSKRFRTA
jgi:hypothetical protein